MATSHVSKYNTSYSKGDTMSVDAQIYHSKRISLIAFRAMHDMDIENFYIGANVEGIGNIKDVCFKFKTKELDRPIAIFARTCLDKDVLTMDNVENYYKSHLAIKNKFKDTDKDIFFTGSFDDHECVYVLFTSAKPISTECCEGQYSLSKINDILSINEKQLFKINDKFVNVEQVLMRADFKTLAVILVEIAENRSYRRRGTRWYKQDLYKSLMTDKTIQKYHVLLEQHVLKTISSESEYCHAYFRGEFLRTKDETLLQLKDSIYDECIKYNDPNKNDIPDLLAALIAQRSDVALSKLIGAVVKYTDGKLKLVHKTTDTHKFANQVEALEISRETATRARNIACEKMLGGVVFTLPKTFGNKDFTMRGSTHRGERRLKYIASKIIRLLRESKEKNIGDQMYNVVQIDEGSVDRGMLQLNGGLAGAVGNLLVLDKTTNLLMFSSGSNLNEYARMLFQEINKSIDQLHKYRLDIRVQNFPKLTFSFSEHEKQQVYDFTKRVFYVNETTDSELANILKAEMSQMLNARPLGNFEINVEAIYLKYLHDIENWCMMDGRAPYLTKSSGIFETTVNDFIKTPLLSVTNVSIHQSIAKLRFPFATKVIKAFKFDSPCMNVTLIVSKLIDLCVLKLAEHFKHNYIFTDLEYILSLPSIDYQKLIKEIASLNNDVVCILIWSKPHIYIRSQKKIKDYLQNISKKRLIVVTNSVLAEQAKNYLKILESYTILHDSTSLVDFSKIWQDILIQKTHVTFQGTEVRLVLILDDNSKLLIRDYILNKIINEDTLTIGEPVTDNSYEAMKGFYIRRYVMTKPVAGKYGKSSSRHTDDHRLSVNTFYDVKSPVVLIAAKPGMGKSCLITHLSVMTKARDPAVWIVRINLIEHSKWFHQWKEKKVDINITEVLRLLLEVIVNREQNSAVVLKDKAKEIDEGDMPFEKAMFLYFFNRREVILAFDGFDEIYPLYGAEVLTLLKVLISNRRQHRVWVTSRSYHDTMNDLLPVFGGHYELQGFDEKDQANFMKLYIRSQWIDRGKFEYIHPIIFCKKEDDLSLKKYPCHEYTYILEAKRLVYQLVDSTLLISILLDDQNGYKNNRPMLKCRALSPLFVHSIMKYLETLVNQPSILNGFTLASVTDHIEFLEATLKKIYFEDKNKMDMNMPGVQLMIDRMYKEQMDKYKKLAAYATFKEHADRLFSKTEINDIEHLMNAIKSAEDKAGILADAADEVPAFTDVTFRQHLAVKYICDRLLAKDDDRGRVKLWCFIFEIIFFRVNYRILQTFDGAFNDWKNSVCDKRDRQIIIDLLLLQSPRESALCKAVVMGLNITALFLSTFELITSPFSIESFTTLVAETQLLRNALLMNNDEVVLAMLQTARRVVESEMNEKLAKDLKNVVSNEEILIALHKEYRHLRFEPDTDSPPQIPRILTLISLFE